MARILMNPTNNGTGFYLATDGPMAVEVTLTKSGHDFHLLAEVYDDNSPSEGAEPVGRYDSHIANRLWTHPRDEFCYFWQGDLVTLEWARRIEERCDVEVDYAVFVDESDPQSGRRVRGEVEAVGSRSVKIGSEWIRRETIKEIRG